jgi:hypothetical protein
MSPPTANQNPEQLARDQIDKYLAQGGTGDVCC